MLFFLDIIDTPQDKEKFRQLYNMYKDLIYWIALKKLNNIEDAEECVQETFFYVAKNMDKVGEVDCKKTKCYLSTIAMGYSIKIYNKSKRHLIAEDEDENDIIINDSDLDNAELMSVFDKVLDEKSKVIFYLKYIYGYTSGEIADMYGVTDAYIRKKIQRSKEKLRKELEQI